MVEQRPGEFRWSCSCGAEGDKQWHPRFPTLRPSQVPPGTAPPGVWTRSGLARPAELDAERHVNRERDPLPDQLVLRIDVGGPIWTAEGQEIDTWHHDDDFDYHLSAGLREDLHRWIDEWLSWRTQPPEEEFRNFLSHGRALAGRASRELQRPVAFDESDPW